MKKLVLILILLVVAGCEKYPTPTGLPSLYGTYSGSFIIEYGGFAPDTNRVYIIFGQSTYSFYYIDVSECAYEGDYTLDGNCNLLVPTDECEHNDQESILFEIGAYKLSQPDDSIIMWQTSSDTLRQYFLKREYWTE